jgi:hypothetical protein
MDDLVPMYFPEEKYLIRNDLIPIYSLEEGIFIGIRDSRGGALCPPHGRQANYLIRQGKI